MNHQRTSLTTDHTEPSGVPAFGQRLLHHPSLWQRLLVVLLIVGVASAIRAMFFGGLGRATPYLTYYPAVMLVALNWGLLAGLLVTALSAALCFFWISRGYMSPVELLALVLFCIVCAMISFICEAMRRAQAKAGAANQELQRALAARQRNEAALRETNEYLDNLFNYANAPIIVWDSQFRITRFNHAFETLTGRRADEVVGKSLEILFSPSLVESSMALIKQTTGGERWSAVEISIRHRDGDIRTLLWNSATIFMPDGKTPLATIAQGHDITERQQAEASRQKFAMLADSSSEFIGMCDLDLQPLYVNPAGLRMVGLPDMAAACRVKVPDYFFPEDQQFIATEFFPRVLREGHGDVEIRLRHFQTGEPICVFYNLFSVRDASGGIVGWATVSRDITERRQTEEAQLQSRRAALNMMADAIAARDRMEQMSQARAIQARIASIFVTLPNEEMFNEVLKVILEVMRSPFGVFGFIDEAGALVVPTMTRQIWDKCQVPDKTFVFPRATWGGSSWVRAIREKKANYSNAVSAKTPAGHVTVTRHINVPILFQGEVIGHFAVANKETDYTEADLGTLEAIAGQVAPLLSTRLLRERAQASLQKSESRLRETQKMAQLGHWHWDVKTGAVEWSEEVFNIFRLDPKTFTPRIDSILAMSPWPEDHARDQELIRKAMESHEKGDYEQRFLRPDGSIGYYHSTFQGDYDDGGKLIAIVGTVMDITERKQAEAEIRELNRSLEQRVEERTAELSAANQELNAFAYTVSHDLRQPLRAMTGFSQALVEDFGATLPGAARGHLDEIILASRHMGELIDGLLRLSRSTRGELQRDAVDLSALAARLLGELAAAEPNRHVTWTVEPGLTARGDERMIEVILANLLGNAWKYTAKTPQPVIRVFGQHTGNEQEFCVADNGAGFDMKHAARLFQPFQRLHREDEFAGIGIGLATVQRIVHRHGGTIRAAAVPGQGATFSFTLSAEGGEIGNHKGQP